MPTTHGGVFQNARLEEYEAALAAATVRGAAKGLRADFVTEMSQLQHELSQLRDHMRRQVRERETDRQTDRDRETHRERQREREGERHRERDRG